MKQFTLDNYTIDQFADYLNGENNFFAGIEGGELHLTGEHHLTKTLNIHFPLTITGDNAKLVGDKSGIFAIAVSSSNVVVEGITIAGFKFGIDIDAQGSVVSNVAIANVTMDKGLCLVETGSSVSNSILRNIKVEGCTMIVPFDEWEQDTYAEVAMCYNICCARHKSGGGDIDNCLLENVTVNNCGKIGQSRVGMNFMNAMSAGAGYTELSTKYTHLVSHNINFTNNNIELCWDSCINVSAGYINTFGDRLDGLHITGNTLVHGINAVMIYANANVFGDGGNALVTNVVVNNNTFTRGIDNVGEPVRGLWIAGSRSDYFPGMTSSNSTVDCVEVSGNSFTGSGVVLAGAYAFLDGLAEHNNNLVTNVNIHHNSFSSVDVPFIFDGCQFEGRQQDWNFGYPPHTKQWTERVEDDSTITMVMNNNRIENLTVTDNHTEGYRYRVVASGATGHGHGKATGNQVVKNIVFERNCYGVGENHVHVQGFMCDGFVLDGGGNEASLVFKNK